FFFQAEDGIRDGHVTGVQTCALPISPASGRVWDEVRTPPGAQHSASLKAIIARQLQALVRRHALKNFAANRAPLLHLRAGRHRRSEERRVGKECRTRW